MNRPVYIAAITLLVLNDHILKAAIPSFITGKLSDVAGLFAFGVFLGTLIGRKAATLSAAAVFVYWKSPYSEPLIRSLPWSAERTVDWTDLIALAVLPFIYLGSRPFHPSERPKLLAAISILAFTATTMAHRHLRVPEGDSGAAIQTDRSRERTVSALNGCGLKTYSRPDSPAEVQVSMTVSVAGEERAAFVYLVVDEKLLTIRGMQVFGRDEVVEKDAIDSASSQLRRCIAQSKAN